jgi:hypothetical protein
MKSLAATYMSVVCKAEGSDAFGGGVADGELLVCASASGYFVTRPPMSTHSSLFACSMSI